MLPSLSLWQLLLAAIAFSSRCVRHASTYAASLDPSKPNIVFIITDDQDVRTGTLDFMPKLHSNIAEQGLTFTHFYAPVSLCCPSRVSLLRAQYAHNHNVTYVSAPYGGWAVFCDEGHNSAYLPIFLQEAGYGTYYTGKLMNAMQVTNIETLPAAGWTNGDFLLDPNTYLFYNATFSANGEAPINYEGTYQMDLIVQKSNAMFQEALASPQPFFLGIAPTAPHMEVQFNGTFTEPIPPPQYAHLYNDTIVPRVPNYNVPVGGPGGGVSWLKGLEELNETILEYIDHVHRQRLRTLKTVDDLVENVVRQVEDAGIANNTYFIFVADNGYALASHRRQPGKTLPFQEDIHIPFMIRGPGIPQNVTNTQDVYSMPDLGATILSLTGAKANYTIDGRSISFIGDSPTDTYGPATEAEMTESPKHTLTEYWNLGAFEGIYAVGAHTDQTYRSLRVVNGEDEWVYGVWCTSERELFNLKNDPWQLTNLAINLGPNSTFSFATVNGTDYNTIATRLDALLLILRRCSGSECLSPWSSIFPNGDETDLSGALNSKYDSYFSGLPKFGYTECRLGFLEDVEGPEWTEALAYGV